MPVAQVILLLLLVSTKAVQAADSNAMKNVFNRHPFSESTALFTWARRKRVRRPAPRPAPVRAPTPTVPVTAARPPPTVPKPTPVTAPKPVAPRPTPVAPRSTPVASNPVPVAPRPSPVAPLPVPVAPRPAPVASNPVPAPVAPRPSPIASNPVPVPVAPIPVPVPVAPIPTPLASNPVPVAPRPAPVVAPVPIPTAPRPAPIAPIPEIVQAPTVAGQFKIDLGFVGVPTADQKFFTNATDRWQSIVIGDLEDVVFGGGRSSLGCTYPQSVDDLHICASFGTIDGAGRVLGYASPSYTRGTAGLTVAGEMKFDSADIPTLRTGNLAAVILHEMGHVLGIGSLWGGHGLQGSAASGCPYRGPAANAEYRAVSGCAAVPPETDGGDGTACGHWDERCLRNELMTGYLNPSGTVKNPLSRITVASLADLGYEVQYTYADTFTKLDLDPSCTCNGPSRQLRDRGPRRQLSADGLALAQEFGRDILAQAKLPTAVRSSGDEDNDIVYVGNREVVVFVEENGSFFDVVVNI